MARYNRKMNAAQREVSNKGRQECRRLRKMLEGMGLIVWETRGRCTTGEASGRATCTQRNDNGDQKAQEAVQALIEAGFKGVSCRVVRTTMKTIDEMEVNVLGFTPD